MVADLDMDRPRAGQASARVADGGGQIAANARRAVVSLCTDPSQVGSQEESHV